MLLIALVVLIHACFSLIGAIGAMVFFSLARG